MSDYHAYSPAEVREAARQLNEEAKTNFTSPEWRADQAAVMTDTIYENFLYESILDRFGRVRNLSVEDQAFVREVNGLKAFWIARGGYIEMSDIRTEVVEIPRDSVGFHVSEYEDKLLTGFSEAASTFVDLGTQRLGAAVNARALRLFGTAIPASPGTHATDSSTFAVSHLTNAIALVREESQSQNISIVGRATAMNEVIDTLMGTSGNGSGFLPETNEAIIRTGRMGSFYGVPVNVVPNYKDGDGNSYWADDDIWVVSDDAAEFAFFGGLRSKEYMEQDNWYWHYLAKTDFGGLVNHPERAHRLYDVG